MDNNLKELLKLQSIDARVDEIMKEKEETPRELKKLQESLDLLKVAVEHDLSTLEELKKERRAVERELEEVDLKFKKSKKRLDEVKSNKEYQAVLKEIEDLKKLTFQKEEMAIKWMEEIETQEKECSDNNARWEESQKEYKQRENMVSKRLTELGKETQSLHNERTKVSQVIDRDLLARYTRLRKNLKGLVVTSVKGGVCQGCHLGIPPQQYNELIRGNSLQSCPHCNRLLYWQGEEELA